MKPAVLFDFYDTIAYRDFEESDRWRQRIADLLGVDIDHMNSIWKRDRDLRMRGEIATLTEHLERMLPELGVAPDPQLIEQVSQLEFDGQRAAVHFYPEAPAVLRALRESGHLLGLLSNTSDAAQAPLESLAVRQYFDSVVLSHEVGMLKPEPEIFLRQCSELGVPPSACVFVADGGFGELDAAHALGMRTIRVVLPGQSRDYGSSDYADCTVHCLSDLPGVLGASS